MAEYYGVVRSRDWFEHEQPVAQGGTYKGSKYIARIKRPSGKYRYIYDTAELAAYKGANNGTSTTSSTKDKKKKKTKTSTFKAPANYGKVSGMSAGSLTYKGESSNTPASMDGLPSLVPAAQEVTKKKKKKKKTSKYKITDTVRR